MKLPEINGIELGESWKLNKKAAGVAIPILLINEPKPRNYVLYSEVEGKVNIRDTGKISIASITNNYGQYVMVRKGTMLKGDTQHRAIVHSVVVGPGAEISAEIKCIYQSKGIRGGSIFYSSGYTPRDVSLSLHGSQSETWGAVRNYAMKSAVVRPLSHHDVPHQDSVEAGMARASSRDRRLDYLNTSEDVAMLGALGDDYSTRSTVASDNLTAIVEKESDIIMEAIKKMPGNHERQVGLFIVDKSGVAGMELFDHPDTWKALSETVVKNYVDILNNAEDELIEINPDIARDYCYRFLNTIYEKDGNLVFSHDDTFTYMVNDSLVLGEFTTLTGHLIHALYTRKSASKPVVIKPPVYRPPVWRRPVPPLRTPSISNVQIHSHSALVVNLLTKKRGFETLSALEDGPKSFGEIVEATGMSTATVTRGLQEAEELGLVRKAYRPDNGGTVYELTQEGKTTNPKRFQASFR